MPYEKKPEDIKLVKGCIDNDTRSQKELFDKYYSGMLAVCDRYSRNREDSRDILQEGFIKVFQNLGGFNFESSLGQWIKRIMVNTAIDRYRKMVREPYSVDIQEMYDLSSGEVDVLSKLTYKDLLSCIRELPDGYRTVFNLYVIEGFNHEEIAEKLGISSGTSKSQLHKARLHLQKILHNRLMINNEH